MLSNLEQLLPLQERQRIHVDLSWKNEDAKIVVKNGFNYEKPKGD